MCFDYNLGPPQAHTGSSSNLKVGTNESWHPNSTKNCLSLPQLSICETVMIDTIFLYAELEKLLPKD